jgi:hypothetical protein
MLYNRNLSRRAVVGGMAATPTLSTSTIAAELSSSDRKLTALGLQLDSVQAALDHANDRDEAMLLLSRIETLSAEIVKTPASAIHGLYIKARATAWALEYDCGLFDPTKESTINDRIAASIIRDLLKLGAPNA